MKAFRTRHCGDCGVCRVGFDHHCAWFDNDVTAPATLSSFVGFLLSIPPLYTLGLGPLFPTAWRTLKRISNFAKSDLEIRSRWWNKWYSWVGGPAFRWILGFGLGTKKWSDMTKAERLPHESVRAPILVALGAVFVFVAIGLAASSLTNLKSGRLTIDVERSKAYWKLEQQMEKLQKTTSGRDHERSAALQRKMDSLAPAQHFRVTWKDNRSGEEKEKIVVLSIQEGLLSHGTPWVNIQRFLGSGNPSGSAPRPAWSLSDSALRKVLQKASIMLPDLDH
nr:conserved hypothetical protein [Melanopsichium pennsylvanicum 4]